MTIYELTQAIGRYKYFLLAGLGTLVILVSVLTFTVNEDGITWRGGLKYQSGFQISVVAPGTASLSEPEAGGNLSGTAAQYAGLLRTGEAAEAVGEMSGYALNEAINAAVGRNSSVISASTIGPTPELANAAARNSFTWLAAKIQQPLDSLPPVTTTIPSTPEVNLAGAFPSTLSVKIHDSLESVSPDLFVLVDAGESQPVAVPIVQSAGEAVVSSATFEAGGSLLLSLETSDGTQYDLLRLAPSPLPSAAPAYPTLVIRLSPGAVVEAEIVTGDDGEVEEVQTIWVFDAAAISTEWIDGVPAEPPVVAETQQLQIAMLTEVPIAEQIGVRRGPLMGFAVLSVGLILLLTSVIVADTWRRDRDEREVSRLRTHGDVSDDGRGDWADAATSSSAGKNELTGSGPDVVEPTLPEQ